MNKVAVVLLFLLLCQPVVNAQTTLQTGSPIERELASNQVHEFSVAVEENHYVELVVEQRGIDVVVKVTSPNGKSLGQFDTPNGSQGPEHVSFLALNSGKYSVTVAALAPESMPSGRYVIKLLEVRQANEQELKVLKNRDAVKARGITLLTDIEGLVPQIKSPSTRIKAQIRASQILWETDPKRASKSITNAIAELKELIAAIDPTEMNYHQYSMVLQLRQEIIQILAERDPDAALDFLYSTNKLTDPAGGQREFLAQETAIELAIVEQIAARHPERALQLARKTLKNTYSSNLIGTIMQLQNKNRDMAAELANEIVAKLLGEKLLKNVDAANLAMALIGFNHQTREQGTDAAKSTESFIAEDKTKELLQKLLNELSSFSMETLQAHPNERSTLWSILAGLRTMGPQLESVVAGSSAMVQKKITDISGGIDPYAERPEQNVIGTQPAEAAMEAIEKAPEELREGLYMQLVHREMANGDVARAKQILNDHVPNSYTRRQVLGGIEQQEVHLALNSGKIEDALRTVAAIRTSRERAGLLSQIIGRIGPGHKRAQALNLLEQARSMLGPSVQAQDETHMIALFEVSRAFARYDVKRSFDTLDPLLDQFNELIAAARVLDGFGAEIFEHDELDVQNGGTMANIATALSSLLGDLAVFNFDRAKASAEKIRLPDVRLQIYLDIAERTVNPDAGNRAPVTIIQ
ncbi:MAG TPA: PPC domain-containing protein [Pyrinomonadaceae bacterium]|nr:PPC domain-containing protein [Pyrinomonadaceae bacterium]